MVPINSLFHDVESCRTLEDKLLKKGFTLQVTNPFTLVLYEELLVKEQWNNQLGEEVETPKSFGHAKKQHSNYSFPTLNCILDLRKQLGEACKLFLLNGVSSW